MSTRPVPVTLPEKAAVALARAAGARVSKTINGHPNVEYPVGSPITSGARVVYRTGKSDAWTFIVRPPEQYITDLIQHAEHGLGIKITVNDDAGTTPDATIETEEN